MRGRQAKQEENMRKLPRKKHKLIAEANKGDMAPASKLTG